MDETVVGETEKQMKNHCKVWRQSSYYFWMDWVLFLGQGAGPERVGGRPLRFRGKMERNTWVGKIPWRRKWESCPVFLPGELHGQRSLVG